MIVVGGGRNDRRWLRVHDDDDDDDDEAGLSIDAWKGARVGPCGEPLSVHRTVKQKPNVVGSRNRLPLSRTKFTSEFNAVDSRA